MSSDSHVQFPSSQTILNPISLGGPGVAAPGTMGGYSLSHVPPNGQVPGSGSVSGPTGPISGSISGPSSHHLHPHPAGVLKLMGLPADVTQREAALIFALVADDVLGIDVTPSETESVVTAVFRNPNTCISAGRILDGKSIFGPGSAPVKVKVEYDTGAVQSVTSGFDSLRLSNAGISPPGSASAASAGIDNYQKRASIGQRSRFLFSDPFSGATTPPKGHPGSIDLSDFTGKSLLSVRSSDGRDYENLPRDPWSAQSQGSMGFASNPHTPGLATVHGAYEWGTSGSGNLPSSASNAAQSQSSTHAPPGSGPPFISSAPADRRRTSSFFNGSTAHVGLDPQVSHSQQLPHAQQHAQLSPIQQSQSQSTGQQEQQQQQQQQIQHPPQHQPPPTAASVISQGPTQQSNGTMQQPSVPPGGLVRNGPGTISASAPAPAPAPSSAQSSSSQAPAPSQNPSNNAPAGARAASKDVPDLGLLARVPPPANPADQNPPCNTLYVGNLPPDATEAELRALFAPQPGFRRLSFRTKNQSSGSSSSSSHNHGPMCFVEFEDVAHATVALAELYGRALPRPNGGNGKGGIRLSFSKNPLGVRGPGNPRRASTNSQNSSAGSSNNGVGNYGYSNYH